MLMMRNITKIIYKEHKRHHEPETVSQLDFTKTSLIVYLDIIFNIKNKRILAEVCFYNFTRRLKANSWVQIWLKKANIKCTHKVSNLKVY